MNKDECLKLLHRAGKILAEEYGYATEETVKKSDDSKHPITLMLEAETGEDWSSKIEWKGEDRYHRVQVSFRFDGICLTIRDLTEDNREVLAKVEYNRSFDVFSREHGDSFYLNEVSVWQPEGLEVLKYMIGLLDNLQEQ